MVNPNASIRIVAQTRVNVYWVRNIFQVSLSCLALPAGFVMFICAAFWVRSVPRPWRPLSVLSVRILFTFSYFPCWSPWWQLGLNPHGWFNLAFWTGWGWHLYLPSISLVLLPPSAITVPLRTQMLVIINIMLHRVKHIKTFIVLLCSLAWLWKQLLVLVIELISNQRWNMSDSVLGGPLELLRAFLPGDSKCLLTALPRHLF